ncbi:hypothetical protein GCM10009547_14630 [Sporichthya brevicatena]|uniref:Anti-sigma-D factor RsdA sigma factor binding region domain-containing protein n=1 Tax=Sporichthya brevicatena TaxID=171442 RepID=A0ABP3RSW4_9ACTN
MSEELKFAALHADDLLLDALGARQRVDTTDDPIAGLLAAYVHEIDSRPGPLTTLLEETPAHAEEIFAAAPALVPAPPIAEPLVLPRRGARAKFLVAHRAAAVVTVGSLVLGIGGVSAAVTGDGGPLENIRRVVGSVTEQVTPQKSDSERISRMLNAADKALADHDLRQARDLLEKARTNIEGAEDPQKFSSLRANLIELRDRWHQAFSDEAAEADRAVVPAEREGDRVDVVPGEGVLSPDHKPSDVLDPQVKPTDKLPTSPKEDLKQAKDKVADRAEQKLEPLPDLPIEEMRAPTWAPILEGILGGDK